MALPIRYLVYGMIYAANGFSGLSSITVTATSTNNSSSTDVTTDKNGKYIIDLQNIPVCNDGDTIRIEVSVYGSPSDTFTLSLSSGIKRIDLTTDYIGPDSGDIYIYYKSLTGDDVINTMCSRWDVDNYTVVVETWLKKSDVQSLRNNIVPGATEELFNILGKPYYYDKTWEGENTLRILPNTHEDCMSNMKHMRNDTIIYVKDFSVVPVKGNSGYLNVKIEGYISGSIL